METPGQTYQIQLSREEAQILGTLLTQLVEENPAFWKKEQGELQKMRYGPISFCISLIDQLSKQLGGDTASSDDTSQTVN